jgi:hypothetical protein
VTFFARSLAANERELERIDVICSSERLYKLCMGAPAERDFSHLHPNDAWALELDQRRFYALRLALLTGTNPRDFQIAYDTGRAPINPTVADGMRRAGELLLELDTRLSQFARRDAPSG